MISSLEEAVAESDERIVRKFLESYDLPPDEARDLLVETKKWLWLFAKSQEDAAAGGAPPTLVVDEPLRLLDEMWHTFILFTREYTDYCQKHFGRYIHHAPALQEDGMAGEADRSGAADRLRARYEYVYDTLGEETVLKWYSEYATRYTAEFVRSRRR
jgi:hypothetical protein